MHVKTVLASSLLVLALTAGASAQSASREILVSPLGDHPSIAATAGGSWRAASRARWRCFAGFGIRCSSSTRPESPRACGR